MAQDIGNILQSLSEQTGWEKDFLRRIYEEMGEALRLAALAHPHRIIQVALLKDKDRSVSPSIAREMMKCPACQPFLMLYSEVKERLETAVEIPRLIFSAIREAVDHGKEQVRLPLDRESIVTWLKHFSQHRGVRVTEDLNRYELLQAAAVPESTMACRFTVVFREVSVEVLWNPINPTVLTLEKSERRGEP